MRRFVRMVVGFGALVGLSGWAATLAAGAAVAQPPALPEAAAGAGPGAGADHVVFVQTDNTAGNQVVAYDRAGAGTLTLAATYDTGGLGGALNGSVVDHLASQGSLVYDANHALLYAVNAGSDTVSVFAVDGDRLALRQVLSSGGAFPVSIAVRGDLVYVLNAKQAGTVAGYRSAGGRLHPIQGSVRSLGLVIPSDSSQFTHTPGQVAFSPDGSELIVTTKANGNDIDVFGVAPNGRLSDSPVVNAEPGTVPFAVTFDSAGHLVVAEAGTNALATFALAGDGTVTEIDAVPTGQAATCWVTAAQGFFYASNAGSGSLSGYQDPPNGPLTLLGATSTDRGTVDAAAPAGGQFLYVETGASGIVDEFHVNSNGSLTSIGSVTVSGAAGGEGIVAS
jgi:6-phosphogluconolactonase (cycloisomerase 2 family)